MTPERLAEIDRELDAFGKDAETLATVIARARAVASQLEGDDGLAALLAEASAAAAQAAERMRAELAASSPVRPPIREHVPVEKPRRAAAPAEPEPERPKSERPKSERPAAQFFDDDEPQTSVMRAAAVEDAHGSSDIAGLSVDELFADAEPTGAAPSTGEGLADLFAEEALPVQQAPSGEGLPSLFDDEDPTTIGSLADLFGESEELRLSDPEVQAVEAPAPRPLTMPPPVPATGQALDLFGDDDEDEETGHFGPAQMATLRSSVGEPEPEEDDDEFELLVDEEILELDSEPPPADEGEKKPGLIGRLLGKK